MKSWSQENFYELPKIDTDRVEASLREKKKNHIQSGCQLVDWRLENYFSQ